MTHEHFSHVSRGDVVRLLPIEGGSRWVGKFGYGRQVETQIKNRRAHFRNVLGDRPITRLHLFHDVFGVFTKAPM